MSALRSEGSEVGLHLASLPQSQQGSPHVHKLGLFCTCSLSCPADLEDIPPCEAGPAFVTSEGPAYQRPCLIDAAGAIIGKPGTHHVLDKQASTGTMWPDSVAFGPGSYLLGLSWNERKQPSAAFAAAPAGGTFGQQISDLDTTRSSLRSHSLASSSDRPVQHRFPFDQHGTYAAGSRPLGSFQWLLASMSMTTPACFFDQLPGFLKPRR